MAAGTTADTEAEIKKAEEYWGYLIRDNKTASEKLERLLRGIAEFITETYEPNDTHDVHPYQLACFYRSVGGDYDVVFLDMPPSAIAFIWKSLGCLHSMQPDPTKDGFCVPSIPALKPKGFVLWQTIQLLLGPEEHVPFLQNALEQFTILDPMDGKPFPKILPESCFPKKPDADMTKWYEDMTERLKRDSEAEEVSNLRNSPIPSVRESSVGVHADERSTAAAYFSNPLYRNPEGRPAIVGRYTSGSPRSTRSPVHTKQAPGKAVARTFRHIWNPHLWDGSGRRDSGHRRSSSGDITTVDHLRPFPSRTSGSRNTSSSSESEDLSHHPRGKSPNGLRHLKSYSSRDYFSPSSLYDGERRMSAGHSPQHPVEHPSPRHRNPPPSSSGSHSRSPSRRPSLRPDHESHNEHSDTSAHSHPFPRYDVDHPPVSTFGPSELPLFATHVSRMQQPWPAHPSLPQHMQQEYGGSPRYRPGAPPLYTHVRPHSSSASRVEAHSPTSRNGCGPGNGSVRFADGWTPARGDPADRARHSTPLDGGAGRRSPIDVGWRHAGDGMKTRG